MRPSLDLTLGPNGRLSWHIRSVSKVAAVTIIPPKRGGRSEWAGARKPIRSKRLPSRSRFGFCVTSRRPSAGQVSPTLAPRTDPPHNCVGPLAEDHVGQPTVQALSESGHLFPLLLCPRNAAHNVPIVALLCSGQSLGSRPWWRKSRPPPTQRLTAPRLAHEAGLTGLKRTKEEQQWTGQPCNSRSDGPPRPNNHRGSTA